LSVLPKKLLKSYSKGYSVEWWMMSLFFCESPSLDLNFCYPSLNFGCVFPWERFNPLILGVSCILPISPGKYSTPCIWNFLYSTLIPGETIQHYPPPTPRSPPYWRFLKFYLKCFLCLRSQHLLCVQDKSQSHPHSLWNV
jgi:hypothetical protein